MHRLGWVVVAALLFGPGAAEAKQIGRDVVGEWQVLAYTNDQSDSFAGCFAARDYLHGINFAFLSGSDLKFQIWLRNPAWHFRIGESHHLRLTLDSGTPIEAGATAEQEDLLIIDDSQLGEIPNRLGSARMLLVDLPEGDLDLQLNGGDAAFRSAFQCMLKWLTITGLDTRYAHAATGAGPPIGTGVPSGTPAKLPKHPGTSPGDYMSEVAPMVYGMLSRAGIAGFRLLMPNEAEQLLPRYDAAWTSPDVMGAMIVLPDQAPDQADRVLSLVSAEAVKDCQGKATATTIADHVSPAVLARASVLCVTSGGAAEWRYALIRRPAGGIYGYMIQSATQDIENNPVPSADDRIMRALIPQ